MKSFVSNCLRNVSKDCPPEEMEVVVRKSHHGGVTPNFCFTNSNCRRAKG